MARRHKKLPPVPTELSNASPEVINLAVGPHAANITISTWDYYRTRELAAVRGCTPNDVIRTAIHNMLENDPHTEAVGILALQSLEFAVAQKSLRDSLVPPA